MGQAAADLDDLMQHPEEEVVFKDKEEEEVPLWWSKRESVPRTPYNVKSFAMDIDTIQNQVCFQETKESPHIEGAATECSFFHYHKTQVHCLAVLLH